MAEPRRWFNPNLPQLLQIAVFLFYFDAVLDLLGILSSPTSIRFMAGFYRALLFVSVAGSVGAANGIANENKWGYKLGVGIAALPFVLRTVFLRNPLAADPLTLLFQIALVALLVHPQSRDYQRVWFK